jgi:hypothetical protein
VTATRRICRRRSACPVPVTDTNAFRPLAYGQPDGSEKAGFAALHINTDNQPQPGTSAASGSTSWGSLVRAQYRPSKKPWRQGLLLLRAATVVELWQGIYLPRRSLPRHARSRTHSSQPRRSRRNRCKRRLTGGRRYEDRCDGRDDPQVCCLGVTVLSPHDEPLLTMHARASVSTSVVSLPN